MVETPNRISFASLFWLAILSCLAILGFQNIKSPNNLFSFSKQTIPQFKDISPASSCLRLKFIIPRDFHQYLDLLSATEYFKSTEMTDIFGKIFYQMMYIAAQHADIPVISELENLEATADNADICYVVRDFQLHHSHYTNYEERGFARPTWVIVDQIDYHKFANHFYIQMNAMNENQEDFNLDSFHMVTRKKLERFANNRRISTLPIGMAQQFTTLNIVHDKIILVDELYPYITEINRGLGDYMLKNWHKTMEIAQLLHEKHGWRILSFAGRQIDKIMPFWEKYPFVELTIFKTVSYQSYLDLFASAKFVFLHTLESYGMCKLEALQLGKPVVHFIEHTDTMFIPNINSVACSLLNSNGICVQMIQEFDATLTHERIKKIYETSNELYCAENWGKRVKEMILSDVQ